MTDKQNIVALILAGGAGNRMGGVDKGLQQFENKPLIEHVITALNKQVNDIIISINRNADKYKDYGLTLITDAPMHDKSEPYQGPLAGLCSASNLIISSNFDYCLVCTCDSPKLPQHYVSKLHDELTQHKADVAVVHDGIQRQNLHCLMKTECLESINTFYSTGERALHKWFKSIDVVDVDFSDDPKAFRNINTLEDLKFS